MPASNHCQELRKRLFLILPTPFLGGSQSYFVRGCKLQLKTALSLLAEVIQNIGMATPLNNFFISIDPLFSSFCSQNAKNAYSRQQQVAKSESCPIGPQQKC